MDYLIVKGVLSGVEMSKFENIYIKSIDVVCPHCNNSMPLDEMPENGMCCICGLSMESTNEL